jgi:hypothetical protein
MLSARTSSLWKVSLASAKVDCNTLSRRTYFTPKFERSSKFARVILFALLNSLRYKRHTKPIHAVRNVGSRHRCTIFSKCAWLYWCYYCKGWCCYCTVTQYRLDAQIQRAGTQSSFATHSDVCLYVVVYLCCIILGRSCTAAKDYTTNVTNSEVLQRKEVRTPEFHITHMHTCTHAPKEANKSMLIRLRVG